MKYIVNNTSHIVLVSDLSDCVDRHSWVKYLKLKKFLEDYEQSLEVLVNDEKMKKFRFDCQASVLFSVKGHKYLVPTDFKGQIK